MARIKSAETVKRVWQKGPPPYIGWWEAHRTRQQFSSWRWWNGKYWSYDAMSKETAKAAAIQAKIRTFDQHEITWTDYYPENARVPRSKP